MAAITAKMVADLRAKIDAPMMECKKALTEANGDMVVRIDYLAGICAVAGTSCQGFWLAPQVAPDADVRPDRRAARYAGLWRVSAVRHQKYRCLVRCARRKSA